MRPTSEIQSLDHEAAKLRAEIERLRAALRDILNSRGPVIPADDFVATTASRALEGK